MNHLAFRIINSRLLLQVVLLMTLASYADAAVTNLVWYRLGEGDPGAAPGIAATATVNLIGGRNLIGNGGPVYTGAISTGASNDVGSTLAVQFSGSHQYFTNAAIGGLTNNFSIEAWVNPNTVGSGTRIIAYNGSTGTNGWGIYQSGTNYFGAFSPGATQIGGATRTATAGTWTHVALVRSGGTAGLFINGVLSGTTTTVSPISPGRADAFAISAAPQSPAIGDFNGSIDEVRICYFGSGQFKTGDLLINLHRVVTVSGTALSFSSAALYGSVGTADLNTSAWFEWGATTNYGNTTPSQFISRTIASTNFNDSISNLMAGVTYQFRAVVSNALGVAYGANLGIDIPPSQVTNTNDSGPGSLRELVSEVGDGGTVTFAPGLTGTITLTSGSIPVNGSVNIVGPGAKFLTIQGDSSGDSVFEFNGGSSLVSGLTISRPQTATTSPGITNNADLTLNSCVVIYCFPAGVWHSQGTLRLLGCTFMNDDNGLFVASGAVAFATNCTFVYNQGNSGGAIENHGTLTLRSCTLVANAATVGGGIWNGGSVDLGNTLVAVNQAYGSTNSDQDVSGAFNSSGFNLIGQGDGSSGLVDGVNADQVGSNASPLNPAVTYVLDSIGPTPTMDLSFYSPAVDRGNSFGTTTDQRGALRPFDLPTLTNAPGGDGSDIGAAEFGAPVLCTTCSEEINVDASRSLRTVDERWMGMNGAIWDSYFDTPANLSLLSAMGCRALRYPGGSDADQFHWATDMSEGNTFKWATAPGNFQHIATNLGAQVFITVNYGTGTTNEAADWVRSANITNRCGFKYWEIGNECYGSWETDSNTVPPFAAHDPWTYAMRFRDYYNAMKAVDPTIKIGAVAITGEDDYVTSYSHPAFNPRTGQYHFGWTPVMLTTLNSLGITPDFLIYHYYPEYQIEDDMYLLQVAYNWSEDAADLRQQLTDYLGDSATNTELVCTENNADAGPPGRQSSSLVDGLYLADSMSQMMKTEFNALMWFCLRLNQDPPSAGGDFNPALYGWRGYGDHGVVSGTTTIYPTYYAMKLMQYFAQPGDTVLECANADPFLSTYAAKSTNGTLTLLAINKDPTNTFNRQITLNNFSPTATAIIRSYGIPQDEATRTNAPLSAQDIATGQMTIAGGGFMYSFPPYSLTLFTLTPAGPMLTASQPAAGTVKISWPWPSTGWNLEQNSDLTTTNWTTPEGTIQNDGTNNFITINPPAGTMFYRLSNP